MQNRDAAITVGVCPIVQHKKMRRVGAINFGSTAIEKPFRV
jgi:hypothetical protein